MARKTNYSEQIINMLKLENVEKRIREKMLYPAIIVGGISKESKETVEFKCSHCGHIWSETFINKYSRYNRALTCPSCKAKLAEGRKVDAENEISTNLEFLDGIALKNYHRIFVVEAAELNDSKGLAIARIDVRVVFRVEDNENEVIVRRGKVQNIRVADMIPVDTDAMVKLLAPVLPELLKFGPQVEKLGYPSEGFFEHHGRSHILRVLTLSLIYYYNSGKKLSERDKNILIYFSLLHDVGRTNEDVDVNHGKASVEKIEGEGLVVDGLDINKRDRQLAHIIIKYHSHSDEDGMNAIRRRKKKHSSEEYFRLIDLYAICKDMDGLDRVRFNGLDVYQLRTTYARKLPLIAGALLKEKIERFVMDPPKE